MPFKDKEKANAYRRQYNKDPENNKRYRERMLKYGRTIDGFLLKAWHRMKRRVTGRAIERTRHIYEGLPLLPKDEFMNWARQDRAFLYLHKQWSESGYDYKLSPSVNRMNGKLGYVLGNIEFLAHADNCALGGMVGAQVRLRRHKAQTCIERILADVQN